MVSMWVDHCLVVVYRHYITVSPALISFPTPWIPDQGDTDTKTLLVQTSIGKCLPGILADRMDEEYPHTAELTSMLRRGRVDSLIRNG